MILPLSGSNRIVEVTASDIKVTIMMILLYVFTIQVRKNYEDQQRTLSKRLVWYLNILKSVLWIE